MTHSEVEATTLHIITQWSHSVGVNTVRPLTSTSEKMQSPRYEQHDNRRGFHRRVGRHDMRQGNRAETRPTTPPSHLTVIRHPSTSSSQPLTTTSPLHRVLFT